MLCFVMCTEKAIVPYFVTGPEPDPLRDRSVLLGLFGQDPLDLEGFLRRLQQSKKNSNLITADMLEVRCCPVVQQCMKRPERGT